MRNWRRLECGRSALRFSIVIPNLPFVKEGISWSISDFVGASIAFTSETPTIIESVVIHLVGNDIVSLHHGQMGEGKFLLTFFFIYILNFSFLCISLSLKTSSSCFVSYLFKCIFELWFFTFLTFLRFSFYYYYFSCFLLIFSLSSFTPRVCNFFLLYSFSFTLLSLGSRSS